jgi:hypothetical protein
MDGFGYSATFFRQYFSNCYNIFFRNVRTTFSSLPPPAHLRYLTGGLRRPPTPSGAPAHGGVSTVAAAVAKLTRGAAGRP